MADEILTQIFNIDLPYEIDMLRSTHRQMVEIDANRDPKTETFQQRVCRNALIESFCVHARSLLNFFANHRSKPDDAIASDFAGNEFEVIVMTQDLGRLRTKLNKQIFHLTKVRTVDQAEKFIVAGENGRQILAAIETAIESFKTSLKPDFERLKCATAPGAPDTIQALPQASATNHFTADGLII